MRFRPRVLHLVIGAAAILLSVRVAWMVSTTEVSAAADEMSVAAASLATLAPAAGNEEGPPEGDGIGSPAPGDAHTPDDPSVYSDFEIEVLQELAGRRQALQEREDILSQREGLLTVAELRVEEKIAELMELREVVADLIAQQQQIEDETLQSLVKVYETMEPADAARILAELDMPVLLQVVGRMKESKLAPVLAAMDPMVAREITQRLVNRDPLPELPQLGEIGAGG